MKMKRLEKIFIAGHRGMAGSAIMGKLEAAQFTNLVTRHRSELDLREERNVAGFFAKEKPDVVILAAAKVGGIKANIDQPAEFLIENLSMQNNVIRAAHEHGVR